MSGNSDEKQTTVKKETILSGMQPTGSLHIGNLEGALRNWVQLQHDYWMYCCIVDWHALTAEYRDPGVLKDNIFQMTVDFLAAGLDPDKCATCLTCVRECVYDAPFVNSGGKAEIEAVKCQGCGNCASACPAKAIQLRTFTDVQEKQLFHSILKEEEPVHEG